MPNNRYEFIVNDDKTECRIFLKRPAGKYVGRLVVVDGQVKEEPAPSVMWLPRLEALSALGLETKQAEAQTLTELGFSD